MSSKTIILINRFLPILLLFLFISSVSSCGYKVHRETPIDSVSISSIENRTFEHGLEDRLRVALVEELMKNGIRVGNTSEYSISGVIDAFELKGVAQKGDITVQYEVHITGKFFLGRSLPEGTAQSEKGSMPPGTMSPLSGGGTAMFPVTFVTEGSLEDVTALKEQAIERAIRDMASEITASVLYNLKINK